MAGTTPKKPAHSPSKAKQSIHQNPKPSPCILSPPTPHSLVPPRRSSRLISSPEPPPPPPQPSSRRSSRRQSLDFNANTPPKSTDQSSNCAVSVKNSKRKPDNDAIDVSLSPVSPDRQEAKKRKKCSTETKTKVSRNVKCEGKKKEEKTKKRVYYKKVVYDGGEFSVGDDVYVKRREDASSDEEDPEIEECRVCFKAGKAVMIECDDCLGGFHLKCLKPPLKEVPEGDWICGFCEAKKLGEVEFPLPPKGKKRSRTLREKLLSSDLWAAHVQRYSVLSTKGSRAVNFALQGCSEEMEGLDLIKVIDFVKQHLNSIY